MRSVRLLAVAVLAVALTLSSAQNASAVPEMTLNPTHGCLGTDGEILVTNAGSTPLGFSYSPTKFITIWTCIGWGTGEITCPFTVDSVKPGLYTITYKDETGSASATFTVDMCAVGGLIEPVNSLTVLAPYVALVGLFAAATVAAVVVFRKEDEKRRHQ